MTRKDWALLIISIAGKNGLSPLRLQKSLFLIKQNIIEKITDDFYEFEPYNYGPFSVEIYRDAEDLEINNFIKVNLSQYGNWTEYSITKDGEKKAEEIKQNLNSNIIKYIKELVEWINNLNFREIVNFIYSNYPDYKVNSIIMS